jgi:hypothetical protein
VRLGTKSSDQFIQELNKKNELIQELYLQKMKEIIQTRNVKAMLGDSSIIEQKTFDPMLVQEFYKKISNSLSNWVFHDVSVTNNEDLRRIFIKFEVKEANYIITCHLSIQFHVLLYYKPDNNVIKYQKELSDIIDKTKNSELKLAEDSEQYIVEKLNEIGYKDLDHKKLFQIFYENDELRDKIYKEIEEKTDRNVQALLKRKKELFTELDNLLLELYQTTPVLIDDSKLVTGEEGVLCTFDIEYIKNNVKEGLFDAKKISAKVKEKLFNRLDEIIKIMKL